MTISHRAAAAGTLLAISLLGAPAVLPPALAATTHASTPSAHPGATLDDVSCQQSFCMAVGSMIDAHGQTHALAQTWNGKIWRVLKSPPGRGLTSVSCSSASFCMASGGPTGAERWNGKTWLTMTGPKDAVTAPSCGTRTLCMVISAGNSHSGAVAESWNGRNWRTWFQDTSVCVGGPPGAVCGLADIACGNGANCVAVGTASFNTEGGKGAIGVFWNGKKWIGLAVPGNTETAAANAVACAGTFCMAVGGAYADAQAGDVATAGAWNSTKQSWRDVSPNLGVICTGFVTCSWTRLLACGSATNCMAFTFSHGNLHWNGTRWRSAPTVSAGRGSLLATLACTGADCVAVGFRTVKGTKQPLAELWNGSAWKILATPVFR